MADKIIDEISKERIRNPKTYRKEMEATYDVRIMEEGGTLTVLRHDPTHIPGNPLFPGKGYVPGAQPPYVVWFTISNK
jgi:hypothetical protein